MYKKYLTRLLMITATLLICKDAVAATGTIAQQYRASIHGRVSEIEGMARPLFGDQQIIDAVHDEALAYAAFSLSKSAILSNKSECISIIDLIIKNNLHTYIQRNLQRDKHLAGYIIYALANIPEGQREEILQLIIRNNFHLRSLVSFGHLTRAFVRVPKEQGQAIADLIVRNNLDTDFSTLTIMPEIIDSLLVVPEGQRDAIVKLMMQGNIFVKCQWGLKEITSALAHVPETRRVAVFRSALVKIQDLLQANPVLEYNQKKYTTTIIEQITPFWR